MSRRILRAVLGAAVLIGGAAQSGAQDNAPANEPAARPAAAAATEGGPRRWHVIAPAGAQMHDAAASDAAVTERLAHGTVLHNLGCERSGRTVWCAVQPLHSRAQGYVVADALRPARGPDGMVPQGRNDSRDRAVQGDFDATGPVRCTQMRGQQMSACTAGVARSGGGDATVVVAFSNGFKRMLFFTHGRFIRADATMSGNGFDTDWQSQGHLHLIRVDDQRYELPDELVFGK